VVDLECIGSNGGLKFNVELDDNIISSVFVIDIDVNNPVIVFINITIKEDSPFEFNSLSFSSDVNFKLDFDFMDIDVELLSDFSSVIGNIDFVLDINLFDLILQSHVNLSSIDCDIVGDSDFEFIDDGFVVKVKFNSSLVNDVKGVNFDFTNDSEFVV
jgi:hypothetical protein